MRSRRPHACRPQCRLNQPPILLAWDRIRDTFVKLIYVGDLEELFSLVTPSEVGGA
jgi:hypothetical protein